MDDSDQDNRDFCDRATAASAEYKVWSKVFASALRSNLERLDTGRLSELGFIPALEEFDPRLGDIRIITDPSLRAVWNFGDYYFFHAEHGDPLMGKLSWERAREAMEALINHLDAGEPIKDPDVLAFADA